MPSHPGIREGILKGLYRYRASEKKNAKLHAQLLGSGTILFEVLKAQAILETDYGVAADVWSVTSYKELYREANDCARWNMLHPTQKAKVPYLTQTFQGASGPFIAASDYMKVLPDSIAQWVPGKLVALGTDGFGRSENRTSLRDFFEVDAKHIVLATLHALAGDKSSGKQDSAEAIGPKLLEKAIRDLGIDPEKRNPATS
jgi:pyruvate dehydrogenase E1 component